MLCEAELGEREILHKGYHNMNKNVCQVSMIVITVYCEELRMQNTHRDTHTWQT